MTSIFTVMFLRSSHTKGLTQTGLLRGDRPSDTNQELQNNEGGRQNVELGPCQQNNSGKLCQEFPIRKSQE